MILSSDNINENKTRYVFHVVTGIIVEQLYIMDNTFKNIESITVSGCTILPIMIKGILVNGGKLYTIPLAGYDRRFIHDVVIEYTESVQRGEPCLIVNHSVGYTRGYKYEDCLIARYMEKCDDNPHTYTYKLQGKNTSVFLYTATIAIPKYHQCDCKHIRARLIGDDNSTVTLAETLGIVGIAASQESDTLRRSLDNPNDYDLYTLEIADYKQATHRHGMHIVIEADIDVQDHEDNIRPVVILSMSSIVM